MEEIRYSVEFQIHEGDEQRFAELAAQCIDWAKQHEEGTLGYEWFLSDDGHTCQLDERFRDSDAMLAHLGGNIVSDILPKLLETSDITGFDVHGDPTPEAEQALAAFGTRNFHSMAGFSR